MEKLATAHRHSLKFASSSNIVIKVVTRLETLTEIVVRMQTGLSLLQFNNKHLHVYTYFRKYMFIHMFIC